MQKIKNTLLNENIFKDFSNDEFNVLLSKTNINILKKILQLDSKNIKCFSILDSNLSQNGFHINIDSNNKDSIIELIYMLKPWRKGPFYIHFNNLESSFCIDSEWRSDIKLTLILKSLKDLNIDLKNKNVLDVGCNNGYYMFDIALRCNHIIGIDPISIFFLQFYFLQKLAQIDNISFRLLGVQNLSELNKKFDLILCLGVLYHRSEPLNTLKILKKTLSKDGILLLETLIIEDSKAIALCPYPTYAGMNNVYYIFSPNALCNLAMKAGFKTCKMLNKSYTTNIEQRSTEFINKKSLGDLLESKTTIEGYPPACRAIFAIS